MKRGTIENRGVKLAYVDFGGSGPGALLLHGLMGRATTWQQTASWLTQHYHVVGLDQRGHGLSDKPEYAYSRADYVQDAVVAIEALDLGPALLIGHSMGGLNGWVLAARRPDLVSALLIEDMGADTTRRSDQAWWRSWLASWPVPFASLAAVRAFFGAQRPSWADYFIEVMREDADGYRPYFSFAHMLETQQDWDSHSYWPELQAVQCPTLVLKGADSALDRGEAQAMARALPHGRYAEVAGAAHVVHYDQPAGWRAAAEPFVQEVLAKSAHMR